MGQSYLYPGRKTENLSPYERELEQLYDRVDRPGQRLNPAAFFQSPDYLQFVERKYGPIPVPPGAQVISQSPAEVRYRDAEGFEHVLRRNVSGGAEGGQIVEQTDRPPVRPLGEGAQSLTQQLEQALSRSLTSPVALAELDEGARARLGEIDAAEKASLQQQQDRSQGDLLARLYGSGIQRSSIAGENLAQMLQQFGLVNQRQQADAATRELGLRQFLTDAGLKQTQTGAGTYADLLDQALSRETTSAGLGLDQRKLDEMIRQFDKGYGLQSSELQLKQDELDSRNSLFNKILSAASVGLSATPAGAFSKLFRGGGGGSGAISGAGSAYPGN